MQEAILDPQWFSRRYVLEEAKTKKPPHGNNLILCRGTVSRVKELHRQRNKVFEIKD